MGRSTSLAALKVLRALLDDQGDGMYGLELIEASGVKAGGLYPTLAKLEEAGWVTSRWEEIDERAEGRRRRRYYQLTRAGAVYAYRVLTETGTALLPPKGWVPA
jgi:PadR family transcriptional regulator